MKSRVWVVLLALIGSGIGAFGLARAKAVRRARLAVVVSVTTPEPEKHKVTADMLASAGQRVKSLAPTFRGIDADGSTQDLAELIKSGPVVLVFIKDGCPCSASASPYFNALNTLYGGRLRMLGIIDGDAEVARRWGSANRVTFPILPDPRVEIAKSYGATNSAFVALVDREGRIDELWPGYAASMLHELNRRASALAGLTQEPFDASDAPEELYSGCPF